MDKLYRHRSFSHSRSHAFYGTVAHITDGKDAGNIGLEQERIPVERPAFRTLAVTDKVRAGQQETALVPLDDIAQPIGPRQRSNEDKHRTRRHTLNLVGIGTEHG